MNVRGANGRRQKRQRTAALQNLAEVVTRSLSRQRLGVRLSSAAFVASIRAALFDGLMTILLTLAATPSRFNVSTLLTS